MGVYTYGSCQGSFSRELTPGELEDWEAALLEVDVEEDYGSDRRQLTSEFEVNSGKDRPCWGGDIGSFYIGTDGFELETEGKVYYIPELLAAAVQLLPEDITVRGSGTFESDDDRWGLLFEGREVIELSAQTVYLKPDGTVAFEG